MDDDDIRGYVDAADDRLILGWAINVSNSDKRPIVEFVQRGEVVCSVTPSFSYPELVYALAVQNRARVSGFYRWRLPFPLYVGLEPDIDFDIRFADNGKPLVHGLRRQISYHTDRSRQYVDENFGHQIMPSVDLALKDDRLSIGLAFRNWPSDATNIEIDHDDEMIAYAANPRPNETSLRPNRYSFLPNGHAEAVVQVLPFQTKEGGKAKVLRIRSPYTHRNGDEIIRHQIRNVVVVPWTVFTSPDAMPPPANIARVSGRPDVTGYFVGGATTAYQLDMIARRWGNGGILQYGRVLDWGCGCSRVLRQFHELPELFGSNSSGTPRPTSFFGVDVDPVNVRWCQENVPHLATFLQSGFQPPIPLGDNSVDMAYGISVMTHLTERAQIEWLRELRRVVTPGGLIVLTANCEWNWLRLWFDPSTRFISQFGIFDSLPDTAIGEENVEHYRATAQSTDHILRNWGRELDIIACIPAANSWSQDFIVMRNPP
jgi:SAM-dependent methyltransferase